MEEDFPPLLMKCLRECATNRRGGLLGHQHPEASRWLKWPEADQLKEMATEIHEIRSAWGQPNALVEKFLEYCALRGYNLPGEPKLAAKFLAEIEGQQ
jgi:hypothetical protein